MNKTKYKKVIQKVNTIIQIENFLNNLFLYQYNNIFHIKILSVKKDNYLWTLKLS